MSVRLVLALAGVVMVLWSIRRWRLAIQVGMLLVILEGAIRKWLLPDAQELVYFAKDLVFVGAYVGFARARPRLGLTYPRAASLYAATALSILFGLFEVVNPQLPNVLLGILGFKAYFLYVPLLFVVPAAFRDDRELARFLQRYTLLSIPVGALAIIQFFSPPESLVNTYAQPTDTSTITTFGSRNFVRVTGSFSYITGYTTYLLATAILLLIILTATRWRWRGNTKTYLALGMTLLGMLMSGSRGPVLLLALTFPLYWWLGIVWERQGGRTSMRLLFGLALLSAGLFSVGQDAVTAFSERASETAQDLGTRFVTPFLAPLGMLPDAGLFGFGIGAAHQAAAVVVPGVTPYSWLPRGTIEAETGRVMLELGPLGFLLVYSLRIGVAVFTFRQVRRLRTTFHRAVAISAFLFFLVEIPGTIVFDTTAGVYFWFLAGLVFLAIRLDRVTVPATALPLKPDAVPRSLAALPPELPAPLGGR